MVDETHSGLAFKPGVHGEDYFAWKQVYAISAAIVCDHDKKIRYLNIGWPCYVHNQRVIMN